MPMQPARVVAGATGVAAMAGEIRADVVADKSAAVIQGERGKAVIAHSIVF
jgi:hypothetical protein